jgi:hypothetical protein
MNNIALIKKALSVATNGASINAYLPSPLASEVLGFVRDLNLMRKLTPTFTMNSRTWRKPKRTSGGSAYYIPDGTTATLTSFAATTVTWTAKKLMTYILVDEEAIEDSQPDVIQQVLQDFAEAIAYAEEIAMLQGDTTHTATAPTPESATAGNWYVRDPRLMFDGLFTVAAASGSTAVAAAGAVFDEDMVNVALYNLGKYGRDKSKLYGVLPSDQAANVRSNSNFKSASISGLNLASFITGLGSAGEADGLITQIYGVKLYELPNAPSGHAVIMRKGCCEIGDRRRIKLASEEVIESDQRKYVTSERIAFQFNYADMTCLIDNLSTTVTF